MRGGGFHFQALASGEYDLKARFWYDPYSKYRVEKKVQVVAGEELTGMRLELDPGHGVRFSGLPYVSGGLSSAQLPVSY